jgi:hypothetical protein
LANPTLKASKRASRSRIVLALATLQYQLTHGHRVRRAGGGYDFGSSILL